MNATTVWVAVEDYYVALDRIKETLGGNWYQANSSWLDTNRKRREDLLGFVLTSAEAARQVAKTLREGGISIEFNPVSDKERTIA